MAVCLLVGSAGTCADWAKMKADYQATRERLEKQGPPACYVTQAAGKTLVFDSRPEFGIGVHGFDQKVADNLNRENPLRPADHVLVCRREDDRAGQVR